MADTDTSSTTAMVAIFAILVLIVIGAFLLWRSGLLGSNGGRALDPENIEIRAPVTVR